MTHHHYNICGLTIGSHRPLGMEPAPGPAEPNATIHWPAAPPPAPPAEPFRQMNLPDGSPWLHISRLPGGFHFLFPQYASFILSDSGARIDCFPLPGLPADSAEHLLLDQVLPFLLTLHGAAILHGSAVSVSGTALAFCGPSGQGKSTLATGFVHRGASLLTDDCLSIQSTPTQHLVLPSYPSVRLRQDSFAHLAHGQASASVAHYSTKRRLALPASAPVPLRRLFFLEPAKSSQLLIEPLHGAALFQTISRTQFVLDTQDSAQLQTALLRASALARSGLCFRLAVPRSLPQLPQFLDAIARHAQQGSL